VTIITVETAILP